MSQFKHIEKEINLVLKHMKTKGTKSYIGITEKQWKEMKSNFKLLESELSATNPFIRLPEFCKSNNIKLTSKVFAIMSSLVTFSCYNILPLTGEKSEWVKVATNTVSKEVIYQNKRNGIIFKHVSEDKESYSNHQPVKFRSIGMIPYNYPIINDLAKEIGLLDISFPFNPHEIEIIAHGYRLNTTDGNISTIHITHFTKDVISSSGILRYEPGAIYPVNKSYDIVNDLDNETKTYIELTPDQLNKRVVDHNILASKKKKAPKRKVVETIED